MSSLVIRPGASLGNYPQRFEPALHPIERIGQRLSECIRGLASASKFRTAYVARRVEASAQDLHNASQAELRLALDNLRGELCSSGPREQLIFRSFALIREVCTRTLKMRPYDVQLLGGWIMMHGRLAEMQTGEGKTLTAALPAATAALAGIPVHVITSNAYLAERDAHMLRPAYEALGLTTGVICDGMSFTDRQAVYRNDIVYCTSQQLGFDYLRDRIAMGGETGPDALRLRMFNGEHNKLLLRGLCFGIVDEADNVLIDEARTPLIIAREVDDPQQHEICQQALNIARQLVEDSDFSLNLRNFEVTLTEAGNARISHLSTELGSIWQGERRARYLVMQALQALHLYQRDKHYLVANGQVAIIDPNSGRAQPDRSWQAGLHQMIECKEGCPATRQRETLASISYQRLFRRFLRLGGMSGTLREVAPELRQVYQLHSVMVPPHRPSQRRFLRTRLYPTTESRWAAVVDRVGELRSAGRPVLIGTCSVAASEHLSGLLTQAGLRHQVLNARQDEAEARIVARAGTQAQITVATNMAGRGTDIKLAEGVAELGGLHVIITELNDARRIDRQLLGRAARQGDPGSGEALVSLADYNTRLFWPPRLLKAVIRRVRKVGSNAAWPLALIVRWPQRSVERNHRQIRYQLLRNEQKLSQFLAFSGELE